MSNNISIVTGSGGAGVAQGVGIGGNAGDAYINVTNIYDQGSFSHALLMSLPRADYASHDSGRKDAPLSCLQGTRVRILDEVTSWLESGNGERPPIYWLMGLAGIGKSTIAKTIADRAQQKKMLGASFFFYRNDGPLYDPRLVFPTIAFQLAHSDDAFKKVILDAVHEDMTVGHKKLLLQLQGLILNPLLRIDSNRSPLLIVLDALDECEEDGAVEILRLLFSLATRIPFLRILITSRPEPHISSVFDEELNHARTVLHDIETSVIQQDIRLYLNTELAKIPHKLRLRLDATWASEDEINMLVEKSGKLFIYAATSIRFISDNRVRNPRRHLHLILNSQNAQEVGVTPYTQLDNLYMAVLRNSLSDSNRWDVLERFQIVVGSIVLLREPLPLRSLAQFIPYEMEDIDTALYHLRSIIIPPSKEDETPRVHHPSFRDFIMDASRCSDPGFVIVAVPEQERRHAIRCLELLGRFLKRNVAGISDPSLLNSEVDGFEGKVRDALSPEVRYACRYWATHLSCVELGDEMIVEALKRFSTQSILWWFEAMSLIGSVSTAGSSVREAHRWAMKSKCELAVVTMLADAHRFVLAHGEVIRSSALHVYESALPFTPHDTALYKAYSKEANHSLRVLRGLESHWPQTLSSLLGHSRSVSCIAYSSDGSQLASGSWDCTVRLWDAISGAPIATLKGHSWDITCIAFSLHGLRLASGSGDDTVRLWDPMSCVPIATLEGHSAEVTCIAFSPDGLQLASGSRDVTVQLWDGMSGAPITILAGHSAEVTCVAFSQDGLCLASGSRDETVRLWDPVSGTPVTTLEGHFLHVSCIAFSPDGLQLASGSWDSTARLWDAASGACIAILAGHFDPVLSVAFSPNGLQLVSGSMDGTAQLWDPLSGTLISTLEGHPGGVMCIAFSPDGLQMASGSEDDGIIQLWDPMSSRLIAKLEGHSLGVVSIAFSPDGLQLASGSRDQTVRLWDPMSCEPITPEGHSVGVAAIAFSPDGLQLASSSWDGTMQLWDAMSGAPMTKLESKGVTSIAFSPDGLQLASGSSDGTLQFWDFTSCTPIRTLEGHFQQISSITFSPDGLQVASGCWDGTIQLWHAMSGAPIAKLEGHSADITSITFSLDGLQLASGCWDGTVQLWDTLSGTSIITLKGHSSGVMSVMFSPDGLQVAAAFADDTFLFWHAKSSIPFGPGNLGMVAIPFLPHPIWSLNDQWIQVLTPPEYRPRRICRIPSLYSLSLPIAVPHLPTISRIAIGCRDGRVVILDIQLPYLAVGSSI